MPFSITQRISLLLVLLWLFPVCSAQAQYSNEFKVVPSDNAERDAFGCSLAIGQDYVFVGARRDDDTGINTGSVYILQQNVLGDKWTVVKKLYANDGTEGDFFGGAVAVSNDHLIVGAMADDDAGSYSGSAYLFARNKGGVDNWGLVKKILPDDEAEGKSFGNSVAIDNDLLIVGAQSDEENGDRSGAAYIFARDEGGSDNWGQVKKIMPSDGDPMDWFGCSVAIANDIAIVGAKGNEGISYHSGSAYVFARDEGGANNWGEVKILAPSSIDEYGFARSVAISNDLVIVSSDNDHTLGTCAGSAYIFDRNEGGIDNWGEIKHIFASDSDEYDSFGASVAIKGDSIIVGASSDEENGGWSGSAYIFARNNGGVNNWGEVEKIIPKDGSRYANFGSPVKICNDFAVAAAYLDDTDNEDAGSVYFYNQPPGSHLNNYPNEVVVNSCIGGLVVPRPITIYSVGSDDLTVYTISDPGGAFRLRGLPALPAVISPGDTLSFDLEYNPMVSGLEASRFKITHDDPNDPDLVIVVEGTGINLSAPGICYGSTEDYHAGTAKIRIIDPSTGHTSPFCEVLGSEEITGVAVDSAGGIVVCDLHNRLLIQIDGITGESHLCKKTGFYFSAIAFDENDTLYACSNEYLFTVDLSTGKETIVATMADWMSGLAFDPTDGTLYVTPYHWTDDSIYIVDKKTGATTLVGNTGLGYGTTDIAFDILGNLYGVVNRHDNAFFSIDKNTGVGTVIGDTDFDSDGGLAFNKSPLQADVYTLSAATGGDVNFSLVAGAENAQRKYMIFGSESGAYPGVLLPGGLTRLPINPDNFTQLVLNRLNTSLFSGFFGALDALGHGHARLTTRSIPSYAGKTIHFAFCLTSPFSFASNPVGIEILP